MGISNHLAGLEAKISRYMGELIAKREEAEKIERLVETLPTIQERCRKLEGLIEAAELLIREDHPDWQRDTIDPVRPQVHHIPIRIGECGRKALEVLRDGPPEGMTARDAAKQVLRNEGLEANRVTIDRVSNSVNAAFKKRRGTILESDNNWPQKWRVIRQINR